MKKRFSPIIFLFLVGFFVADMAVDAVSSHEEAATTATMCHDCACGFHFLPEAPASLSPSVQMSQYVVFEPAVQEFISIIDIFHPPALLS